jgi:predicted lysophospholipase L1 biosynthesis ABC-type transport system permease subunit
LRQEYLGPNPVGKRFRLNEATGPVIEVVGVTMTGKTFSLVEPPVQLIHMPLAQNPRSRMTLIAETSGEPAAFAAPLREVARSIDPDVPVFRVRIMEDVFERSSVNTIRMVGRIYDSAAGLGLVLVLVGLYAVVSYQVARRTREIGIRMALGAEQIQVARIFLTQALAMSLIGITAGLVLSWFGNQMGQTTLGILPLNPVLMAAASMAMLLATITASLVPAHRASRIDPQQALRQD